MTKFDAQKVAQKLQNFLKKEIGKIGFSKAVIGLSGGVDSSVVASLLQRGIGAENVYGLIMPYRKSNPNSATHAIKLADELNISYDIKEITPIVDAFFADDHNASALRKGNRMARERMCLLYDYSAKHNALVVGTSNKTEILLGYGTIFGDLACAINPIGDLYKTQIWQLARYLEVPNEIIEKAPSADLWQGQTDEEELGYTYKAMDKFLSYMIDEQYSDEMLLGKEYSRHTIDDIKGKIERNTFKGKPPVIARLND